MGFPRFSRGSEWAPIYMLIVIAIAVVVLIALVKPMFRRAQTATGVLGILLYSPYSYRLKERVVGYLGL